MAIQTALKKSTGKRYLVGAEFTLGEGYEHCPEFGKLCRNFVALKNGKAWGITRRALSTDFVDFVIEEVQS
jgi:hypothetical protein